MPASPATLAHSAPIQDQDKELSQAEVKARVQDLSGRLIGIMYEIRTLVEKRRATVSANASIQNRAKDDDDSSSDNDDSDDSTTKLINKAAHALRPIIKELANAVNSVLPAGPSRQLVKATASAVDSLMPLILKYALGI
ncbi:hypothetical protein LPJ59_007058 [Coemansia sp. RSA 2399]|nr:hypothetical protein LPJ59_007058 [Coemansia sp. RSA 2399]KAJ1884617.1 hypothetical protein LPJ81_007055 [Coemansia sp. IMI 209127]